MLELLNDPPKFVQRNYGREFSRSHKTILSSLTSLIKFGIKKTSPRKNSLWGNLLPGR